MVQRPAAVCLLAVTLLSPDGERTGLPLTGEAAVDFLHKAEIVGHPQHFDAQAITRPLRVTLTDGDRTARAIFKYEHSFHMIFRFADGRAFTGVRDSYRHEIAAYELDVLLDLGIVPPCVERSIRGRNGSLCMWVENAMTEADRLRKKIHPPDTEAWNRQMHTIRLFHQLIWDLDYNNTRNTLVDANFRLYKVDSSLCFRPDSKLRNEESLLRFSSSVLERLASLDRSEVDRRLEVWLTDRELEALWARRTRLLQLASEEVEAHGADAVLFDDE